MDFFSTSSTDGWVFSQPLRMMGFLIASKLLDAAITTVAIFKEPFKKYLMMATPLHTVICRQPLSAILSTSEGHLLSLSDDTSTELSFLAL